MSALALGLPPNSAGGPAAARALRALRCSDAPRPTPARLRRARRERSRARPPALLGADRIDMHLAPPADQRDDTGPFAVLDMAGHDVVHAAEPRLGQSSDAHHLFPPPLPRHAIKPSGAFETVPWNLRVRDAGPAASGRRRRTPKGAPPPAGSAPARHHRPPA